jgi:VWFA-related protein
MPRRLLGLLFAAVVWAPVMGQGQAPTQALAPPQFRAGVEVMRVEMTVLDKRTRAPIRGLTAKDFVVKVNGVVQEVVAFSEVVTTPPATEGAAWTREASPGVATNTAVPIDQQRLIVIIMDDVLTVPHIGAISGGMRVFPSTMPDPYNRKVGKAAAHRIVDELGPHDRAAILFPQFNQHAQDFTSDRSALRRAIDTYNPQELDDRMANAMSLGVLRRAGEFLASIPDRRGAIFYITTGPKNVDQSDSDPLGWAENVTQRMASMSSEGAAGLANAMRPVTAGSRLAHVPVYPISTLGLEAPPPRELLRRLPPRSRELNENLHHIARTTGGRAIVDNNAPDKEVAEIFQELSSYYVLAYAAKFPMDGKLRRFSVDVNDPRAMVEPDDLVLATPRATPASSAVTDASGGVSGLLAAIASPLPTGSLPLQLVVSPFADAGVTRATTVMTLGVAVPGETSIDVRVFDGEGRKEVASRQLTARMTPGGVDPSTSEVAIRLDLKPGRYNVRVGAAIAGTELSGSVFTTFTVPDFDKEPLSLSGIAIGKVSAKAIGGRDTLADLLPFAPTVERQFTAADIVGALVRIHQPPGRIPTDVTLDMKITSAAGAEVSRSTNRFTAAQFEATRHVEQRTELALSALVPGDYLLTFTATAAAGIVSQRDVRFTVR